MMVGLVLFSAHRKNWEATIMKNDPIVDEVRNNGVALAARYNNDVEAICRALKEREQSSGRMLVNRKPRRLVQKSLPEVS